MGVPAQETNKTCLWMFAPRYERHRAFHVRAISCHFMQWKTLNRSLKTRGSGSSDRCWTVLTDQRHRSNPGDQQQQDQAPCCAKTGVTVTGVTGVSYAFDSLYAAFQPLWTLKISDPVDSVDSHDLRYELGAIRSSGNYKAKMKR